VLGRMCEDKMAEEFLRNSTVLLYLQLYVGIDGAVGVDLPQNF
jgi:hypothetical protein